VEVSVAAEDALRGTASLPLGAVRLLEEHGWAGVTAGRLRQLLRERLPALPVASGVDGGSVAGVVGTGGNIDALAALAGAAGQRLGLAELGDLIDLLATLSFEERVARLGLRRDRADVILPAAVVYERVAELAGAGAILAPGVGLKEGLVLEVSAGGGRARDVRSPGPRTAGTDHRAIAP